MVRSIINTVNKTHLLTWIAKQDFYISKTALKPSAQKNLFGFRRHQSISTKTTKWWLHRPECQQYSQLCRFLCLNSSWLIRWWKIHLRFQTKWLNPKTSKLWQLLTEWPLLSKKWRRLNSMNSSKPSSFMTGMVTTPQRYQKRRNLAFFYHRITIF